MSPPPTLTGASCHMPDVSTVANTGPTLHSSNIPLFVPSSRVPTATPAPANTSLVPVFPAIGTAAAGSPYSGGGGLNAFLSVNTIQSTAYCAQGINTTTSQANESIRSQPQPLIPCTSATKASKPTVSRVDLVQPQPSRPVPQPCGLSLSRSPTVQLALQPKLVQPTLPQFAAFNQLPQQSSQVPNSRAPSLQASTSQTPTPSSHTHDHKPEFKIVDVVCKSALQ